MRTFYAVPTVSVTLLTHTHTQTHARHRDNVNIVIERRNMHGVLRR